MDLDMLTIEGWHGLRGGPSAAQNPDNIQPPHIYGGVECLFSQNQDEIKVILEVDFCYTR